MEERRKSKKYIGKFLEADYAKFQNDFLALLKDYKRKTQRLDKIIVQSDKQQFRMLLINEELEEYKKKLEDRLETDKIMFQQSRQAQIGEMISMIAHQWRQPLTAISATIVGMQLNQKNGKYDFDDKEQLKEFLANQDEKLIRMNSQVKALSTIIDDFRDFFKPAKQKRKVFLSSPIKKALSIILVELETKGIVVNIDFQVDKEINIYENEIMQVILNLLQNSEDSLLHNNIENPQIDILTFCDNDGKSVISIKDNGVGISEDILDKIFDPYFSTKESKNGTGIGLYMSKMIIEEHNGGKITAQNTNNGVCFRIKL